MLPDFFAFLYASDTPLLHRDECMRIQLDYSHLQHIWYHVFFCDMDDALHDVGDVVDAAVDVDYIRVSVNDSLPFAMFPLRPVTHSCVTKRWRVTPTCVVAVLGTL